MKTNNILSLLILLIVISSCTKVPITGRRQLNMLPESDLMSMSLTEYDKFLKENKRVADSDSRTIMVKKVGKNIEEAVTTYLKKNLMGGRIKDYKWEYNLVDDAQVNAWCMSGGKVVVYTGLLPVTQDETGLAVVMGHEIAHAIARHGNERMSQQMAVQLGGIGLGVASANKSETTKAIFNQAYGLGSTLGVLKYSRNHESEADKMGLVFMAMAGYDPAKAVDFWQRMAQTGGAKPPEFLSTHPSSDTRIAEIKEFLPEAMKYYKVRK